MSRAPARSKVDLIGHISNDTSPVWDHLLCLFDICTWSIFNFPDVVFSRSDRSVEHRASHPLSRTPANRIRTVNNRRALDSTIFLNYIQGLIRVQYGEQSAIYISHRLPTSLVIVNGRQQSMVASSSQWSLVAANGFRQSSAVAKYQNWKDLIS